MGLPVNITLKFILLVIIWFLTMNRSAKQIDHLLMNCGRTSATIHHAARLPISCGSMGYGMKNEIVSSEEDIFLKKYCVPHDARCRNKKGGIAAAFSAKCWFVAEQKGT